MYAEYLLNARSWHGGAPSRPRSDMSTVVDEVSRSELALLVRQYLLDDFPATARAFAAEAAALPEKQHAEEALKKAADMEQKLREAMIKVKSATAHLEQLLERQPEDHEVAEFMDASE